MSIAFSMAVKELQEDIDKYDVFIKPEQRIVGFGDSVIQLAPQTTSGDCKRMIKGVIEAAKQAKKQRQAERQMTLFG